VLPRAEFDNLLTAVFHAGPTPPLRGGNRRAPHLAAEGLVVAGYDLLLVGKLRALEGEANFEPSAEAVEEAWDGAIRRDARRWGAGGRDRFQASKPLI
jgi:hypothetical protein